jgi:predicted CXXCH cytochrome family protein
MKHILWIASIAGTAALLFAIATLPVNAQTVVGTNHDLSTGSPGATTNVNRVCVFCHTPHQAAAAFGQPPLWNHTLSGTAAYGIYDVNVSPTMDAVPVDIGGAAVGSASVSNLCMSCHDGTVAVQSLYNAPNEAPILDNPANITVNAGGNVDAAGLITGNPNVGIDLTNDHPVNFTYDTALAGTDGGLNDPATTPAVAALLFGGTVQCASCHDPHDNTNGAFLVMSNVASALCVTCHTK